MDERDDPQSLSGTWTSAEVAKRLGIGDSGVRMLVKYQKLAPVRAGARPLRFHKLAVVRLEAERRSPGDRQAVRDLWAEVDAHQT